ncbi:Mitochondrial carrier [Mycena sanguinolenta]|uniref:Mitochondrial carrier n=1 Tax=Mycena sanguinolenta TaxID=230812 RepID=A0A8H7DJN0_9AGAR|nr:Mitochondrial carrier [Mycena sanguinolenta]
MFIWNVLTVPFNGVVVRYRAASHPKASVEDGSIPPPPTFLSMTKRVWRLQGVEGLTRGLMPTIGIIVFSMLFWRFDFAKVYVSPSPPFNLWSGPISNLISTSIYEVFLVAIYRSVTSPRKLDVLNAREALHVLFSLHERKKPWAILQTPGLLPALFINLGVYHFFTQPLTDILLPWRGAKFSTLEYAIRVGGVIFVALLATIVRAPLEVIATRLALQRNYGGIEFVDDSESTNAASASAAPFIDNPTPPSDLGSAVPQVAPSPTATSPLTAVPETQTTVETELSEKVEYPVEKPVETTTAPVQPVQTVPVAPPATPNGTDLERGPLAIDSDDIVVHLHNENEPYLGLLDCAKRIVAEEVLCDYEALELNSTVSPGVVLAQAHGLWVRNP